MTRTTYILLIVLFLLILLALAGCTPAPLVKTVQVPVTKYVRAPIPPALLAACEYVEPDKACVRGNEPVFCNGQIVQMLIDYRNALETCNSQITAIKSLKQ